MIKNINLIKKIEPNNKFKILTIVCFKQINYIKIIKN